MRTQVGLTAWLIKCANRASAYQADATPRSLRGQGIQAQYEKAPEPRALIILESSAHAQFLFQTDQAERVMREILRFLSAK
jgi:hypothetical protein